MEHLVFIPSGPSSVKTAFQSPYLSTNWQDAHSDISFQKPITRWFRYDHREDPATAIAPTTSKLADYSMVRGWDRHLLWQGKFRDANQTLLALDGKEIASRVVALLQSWFYFGLLESVTKKPIDTSYFVRNHSNDIAYINSRNLHFCLQSWIFKIRLSNFSDDEAHAVNIQVLDDLSFTSDWIRRFNIFADPDQQYFHQNMEHEYPGFGLSFSSVVPCIIRLGEAINCARLTLFQKVPSSLSWHYPDNMRIAQENILIEKGWCPYMISIVEAVVGFSVFDWLTTLPRWPCVREHEHGICTKTACARNTIDSETYLVFHHPRCCQPDCAFIKPPLEDLLIVLYEGNIPIIKLEDNGTLSVSSHPTTEPGEYIAFSHVWVDGIGSTAEEGLPACQVKHLHETAREATKESHPYFWIDSLCVPKKRSARKKAIIAMHTTYACASEVIVLDRAIQAQTKSCSSELLFAVIFCSGWMMRLWTYQEAVLARKLTFKFSDGLYSFKSVLRERPASLPQSICVVWRDILSQLLRLRGGLGTRDIASVTRDLNWRYTSSYTDEMLAVAGMLGVDAASLLDSDAGVVEDDDEEKKRVKWSDLCDGCKEAHESKMCEVQQRRMITALITVRKLPHDIIFLMGPKLSVENFHWAPQTFMLSSELRLDPTVSNITAVCDNQRLRSTWWALSLAFLKFADNKAVMYVGSVEQKSAFRIFMKESWPACPGGKRFDMVIIDGTQSQRIRPGEHKQGLAALNTAQSEGKELICEAVGPVLVELLHEQEAFQLESLPMFRPPDDGIAFGILDWEDIVIK